MVTFLKRSSAVAAGMFLLAVLLLAAAGCGSDNQSQGPVEQIGYMVNTSSQGQSRGELLLTSTAGVAGEKLLEWRGSAERFFFSNDGRYFCVNVYDQPPGAQIRHRYFIAATDGGQAVHLPGRVDLLSFSPDSRQVAYMTLPLAGPNDVVVMNLASGETRTLASGNGLLNPTWVDDKTLIYSELGGSAVVSRAAGGIIHRVNLVTGQDTPLTPADRKFSTYSAPVTLAGPNVALIERAATNNLWSLDVASGELKQITNNTQDHFRAAYLPDGRSILFQQQKNREDTMSSELCVLSDDGSDFRMLTSNFFFDGIQAFSPVTGRIVYQQAKDTGETSIWTVNDDGTGATKLVEGGSQWVGDPNFAPVSGWQNNNPLRMTVEVAGEVVKVTAENTSDQAVEGMLRAFPGSDLILTPAGGHQTEAVNRQPADPGTPAPAPSLDQAGAALEWSLRLQPGEKTEVGLQASLKPSAVIDGETALLLSLAAPGSPPRMFWDLQGLLVKPNV